ncbi:MAG: VOC family protein [Bdellovibrio sp.]
MGFALTSITLNTPHLQDMLEFYQILGFSFTVFQVDKGSEAYRARQGGIEISLYSTAAPAEKARTPSFQWSFQIADLEKVVKDLEQVSGTLCILDPTMMADGKKAIILDPDGNAVELSED